MGSAGGLGKERVVPAAASSVSMVMVEGSGGGAAGAREARGGSRPALLRWQRGSSRARNRSPRLIEVWTVELPPRKIELWSHNTAIQARTVHQSNFINYSGFCTMCTGSINRKKIINVITSAQLCHIVSFYWYNSDVHTYYRTEKFESKTIRHGYKSTQFSNV